MGQLEKYGLYVLCLVIFLILGVALWGEPAAAGESGQRNATAPKSSAGSVSPSNGDIPLRDLLANAPRPENGPSAENGGGDGGRGDKQKGGAERDGSKGAAPQAPARAEPAAPKPEGRGSHKIIAGDTLEGIAKGLGDVRLVPLLVQLNPGITPEKMRVGKALALPTAAEIEALRNKNAPPADKPVDKSADKSDKGADRTKAAGKSGDKPAAKPDGKPGDKPAAKATGRTHTIEKGDTLEGLAVRYFGSSKRVDDIKTLNPSVDPTRLRIGQIIRLPD